MKADLKTMMMAVVAFLATAITASDPVNWVYVVVATIGFLIIYVIKNMVIPSNSGEGEVNGRDILSGIILAIGMAISSGAASWTITGQLDWKALGLAVVGAVIGYFTKTIPTGIPKKR